MKINKLKKVLSKSNNLIISRTAGTQWIGDGVAMYSMEKFPYMTPDQILTIIGVPDDPEKRALWYVEEYGPEIPELQQITLIDRTEGNAIEYGGVRRVMLEGADSRVFWTKEMYLEPQESAQTEHYICADKFGTLYLASFEGMFMTAVIRQQDFSAGCIEWLHAVSQTATARHTEALIKNMQEEEKNAF